MLQSTLPLLAMLLLISRIVFAFRQAEMKSKLKIAGNPRTVVVNTITEEWEKKAVGRAKTGGGYIRMPYNGGGTISKNICYVPQQAAKKTLIMKCEK